MRSRSRSLILQVNKTVKTADCHVFPFIMGFKSMQGSVENIIKPVLSFDLVVLGIPDPISTYPPYEGG